MLLDANALLARSDASLRFMLPLKVVLLAQAPAEHRPTPHQDTLPRAPTRQGWVSKQQRAGRQQTGPAASTDLYHCKRNKPQRMTKTHPAPQAYSIQQVHRKLPARITSVPTARPAVKPAARSHKTSLDLSRYARPQKASKARTQSVRQAPTATLNCSSHVSITVLPSNTCLTSLAYHSRSHQTLTEPLHIQPDRMRTAQPPASLQAIVQLHSAPPR